MTDDELAAVLAAAGAGLALVLVARALRSRRRKAPATPVSAGVARLCLALTWALWVAAGAAGLVAALVVVPQLLVLAAGAAVLLRRRTFRGYGWAHGTARWAIPAEQTPLLAGRPGLPVGTVDPPALGAAADLLLRAPWHASEGVCRLFLAAVGRRPAWATLAGTVHTAVVAPTGAGKGQSLVIPWLLTHPGAAVVVDPKGENARATAAHRRRAFGHRVVLLDPFRLVTDRPDTLNPLDAVDPASPHALDAARAVAEALVVRTGEEKDPHWGDAAELWVWALAALTALKAPPDVRNLQTVATLLADPAELAAAADAMRRSDAWGGMLARLGHQLGHFVDRELGSTLTTANRHLRFLGTPAVVDSTRASTFDPRALRGGRVTVYLVLPTEYLRSHAGLLRVWVGALLRAAVRGGVGAGGEVHFLLDEFAALGHLPSVEDALAQYRGYGVRLQVYLQSLGQLEACFPRGQGQTFLANMAQVYFGVNDVETAEYVSRRLGDATVPTWSETGGTSRTRNTDPHGLTSRSDAANWGYTAAEAGRRLLTPAEVIGLGDRRAVVFAPGLPPVLTRLVRAYEPAFRAAPGLRPRLARVRLLARAAGLLAATAAALAALLAAAVTAGP